MKAQVEQLAEMSETLESAGFSRPKSNAVIESVAMAMETFAVTPELVDDRIGGLRSRFDNRFNELESRFDNRFNELENRFNSRFDGLREEMNVRFAAQDEDIKALRQSVDRLDQRMDRFEQRMDRLDQNGDRLDQKVERIGQAMFDLKQSVLRYMIVFTLLMLGAATGVFETIIARMFL